MCTNGNYRVYAIDPDGWDKYVILKSQAKKTSQIVSDDDERSPVEDDETMAIEKELSIGTKSW